jgi:hypothetical protein
MTLVSPVADAGTPARAVLERMFPALSVVPAWHGSTSTPWPRGQGTAATRPG